jgi:hypothetical protein
MTSGSSMQAMTYKDVLMPREAGYRDRLNLTGPPQPLQISMSMLAVAPGN